MLTICTWLWGGKYSVEDVIKLKRGLDRNMDESFRFMVMTERERSAVPRLPSDIERHVIKDPHLTSYKGCFVRLRMFDPKWQKKREIEDRLVCLDLDLVITGKIGSTFKRDETFVILSGANAINPCPFNGSVMMLRAGHNERLWSDFTIEKACEMPHFEFPDDQGWFHYKLPGAATWKCGKESGIYAFRKPGWPSDDVLPADAKIVAFPGKRQPRDFRSLKWVRDNW